MSVGKIALGVFLGNVAFALLAWLVLAVAFENAQRQALFDSINTQYEATANVH